MHRSIIAIVAAASSTACDPPPNGEYPPEVSMSASAELSDFTETIWYDLVTSGASVFFDFKNMREGVTSKNSEDSDLESHFGNTIDGCGKDEIHCMEGGVVFSIPKSESTKKWGIKEYRCEISGSHLNGNVDCYSSKTLSRFQYNISEGNISEFNLTVQGYPSGAFSYRSRKSGIPISVLKTY